MTRPLIDTLVFLLLISAIVVISKEIPCKEDSQCPPNSLCEDNLCEKGPTGTGIRCKPGDSSSCREDTTCLRMECTCKEDTECFGLETCIQGKCSGGFFGCTSDKECLGGRLCYQNHCTFCFNSEPCPAGTKCVDLKCRDASVNCTSSVDCPSDERCIFGDCLKPVKDGPCQSGLDCIDSQKCSDNKCEDGTSMQWLWWLLIVFLGFTLPCALCFCLLSMYQSLKKMRQQKGNTTPS